MLAGDPPRLIGVNPNADALFETDRVNNLTVSPTELTFRFDGGQQLDAATLDAITIQAAGGDQSFDDGNERTIKPGFLGFGDSPRIVIARFIDSLPDDLYRVQISGYDDPAAGVVGLRNTDGLLFEPLNPAEPSLPTQEIYFDLELGARVLAVVPQPIEGIGPGRAQRRDQIHVYFNEDPLSNPAAGPVTTSGVGDPTVVTPGFYQLIYTADTVENTDDVVINPTTVTYNPATGRAVLTFASDLSEWQPVQNNGGAGTLRLRVGTRDPLPTPPVEPFVADPPGTDAADTFVGARNLGADFSQPGQSVIVNSEIMPTREYLITWPGGDGTPGVRNIRRDDQLVSQPDSTTGITTYYYNFAERYGADPQGNLLDNAITDAQKQRTREVLALYEQHLGVRFVETQNRGLQIVTGDMRVLNHQVDTGAGRVFSLYRSDDSDPGRGLLILDGGENWYDGYGFSPDTRPSWFAETLRGVGSLLGIGDTFEQPVGVASAAEYGPLTWGIRPEPDFLSQSDITVGQLLHRPESVDIDLYKFSVSQRGTLTAETFAERLLGSSLLDTSLKLWRQVDGGAPDQFELFAVNDDFFSNDSFVGVEIPAGNYVIGVSASGNDQYDPQSPDSGLGGRSEGRYQLRLGFEATDTDSIVDAEGSRLDGDADGIAGGTYNFWFRTARPTGVAGANQPRTIFVAKEGNDDTGTGTLNAPLKSITAAMDAAKEGDIIRLLPNAGADGRIDTLTDNLAYEVGRGGVGTQTLPDGPQLEVKRGVTLMIDAGVIFKMRSSKISVGSESIDTDRSKAALQVLGTPVLVGANGTALRDAGGNPIAGTVRFTSYDDQTIGRDNNPLNTVPGRGHWGGIEFRNDFDYSEGRPVWEAEGIFLNYVGHADIQYGGGRTSPTSPIVTAIQMSEARPTLHYNTIRNNADAAISADPDSFAETNFHAPVFQRVEAFTSDYQRVGPDLAGNRLANNSVNGLFVRIDTPAAGQLEPMTVSGRFDDRDITHVLSQVLVLQGTPGGPILLEDRPDVLSVVLTPGTVPGSLTPGTTYNYVLTYVDADGNESLASLPTRSLVAPATGSLRLNNLPPAPSLFAGRRLYRLNPGSGQYELVTQLDRSRASYTDVGTTRGGTVNTAATTSLLPRFDARLSIDPAVVVKSQTARIEATFGADFYAEGVEGREIIFTSRVDDRYGAGGTFDTNNDALSVNGNAVPAPGDWGGLIFGQGSTASVDHALITFGGGSTPIEGGFAHFNAMEIVQADVRVTHSVFEQNADGFESISVRGGNGFNDPAALFVRGAQPVIVENVFRNNLGAAISINPDALDFHPNLDSGRATGPIDRYADYSGNQGPLVRLNQLSNNSINGMAIRPEVLTTESVWDDTDIVHVVLDEILTVDVHHNGGLRLESGPTESLVVKFAAGAGLTATGRPLDIIDRIGGTLQVSGQPGFPVILTSLHDDSVGAGFTAGGVAQQDTDNQNVAPTPGDWRGLLIDTYANDRNVQVVLEAEAAIASASGQNAVPSRAQRLGRLARGEKAGDENDRLGFQVQGTLSEDGDLDIYSFDAVGGTEVWIDIDRTTYGLDTVVELIDINGNILYASNDSFTEDGIPGDIFRSPLAVASNVNPLRKSGVGMVETPNSRDAGFRVILPGSTGAPSTYYVRVRSSNLAAGDPASKLTQTSAIRDGLTEGIYRLAIRLRETDEVAGSSVRLADIRFADIGVQLVGAPLHSPLLGEAAEQLNANGQDVNGSGLSPTIGGADPLGNLMNSDRGALAVSGVIGNHIISTPQAFLDDVDVYRVDLFYDAMAPAEFSQNRFVPVTFDVDYADGLGRVNTALAIYDASGRLILHSRDSNIADDVGRPLKGNDMANLAAGSAGVLDAHIGPVELQEGTYYVAVTSDLLVPDPLGQFFNLNGTGLVRLAPVDSVRRIFDDGMDGTAQQLNHTADRPIVEPAFDAESFVQYTLSDLNLFVSLDQGVGGGSEQSSLIVVDPFTGQFERVLGEWGQPTDDIAIRGDGELHAISMGPQTGAQNSANTGNFLNISSQNAAASNRGDDGLTFRRSNAAGTGTENDDNAQLIVHALTFDKRDTSTSDGDRFYAIGHRDTSGRFLDPVITENILYSFVSTSGAATNRGSTNGNLDRDFGNGGYNPTFGPGSNKQEFGVVDTSVGEGGRITGMAMDPSFGVSRIYAVDDRGGVYRFNPFDLAPPSVGAYDRVITPEFLGQITRDDNHTPTSGVVSFSSLTFGPRNTEGGLYRDTLFATTRDGWIYALQIENDPVTGAPLATKAPVLYDGHDAIPIVDQFGNQMNVPAVGIAFSTLENSPWHTTSDRRGDAGHGVYMPYDQSRQRTALLGGNSLYFGFEPTGNEADNRLEHPDGNGNTLAPGGSHGTVVSKSFDLSQYSPDDKPTVYFSYFLEAEADDDYLPGVRMQNDSFRVFASGDDGQWQLLATNNDYRALQFADEYDYAATTGIPVQELFDDANQWRQARIDISPLAGHEQVRLRFDYSTYGAMSFGSFSGHLNELQMVPGHRLADTDTFRIDTTTFEIVKGGQIRFPAGSQIVDGEQIRIDSTIGGTPTSTTLRFVTAPTGNPGEIVYQPTMTADQIGALVAAQAPAALDAHNLGGGRVQFNRATGITRLEPTSRIQSSPPETFRIQMPAGADVNEGETITITPADPAVAPVSLKLVTPGTATSAPDEVVYDPTDTPEQLANRILPRLPAEVQAQHLGDGVLQLVETADVDVASNSDIVVIDPLPVVAPGNVPVFVTDDMDVTQVGQAVTEALAIGVGETGATSTNYKQYAGRIRLYDTSPFGFFGFGGRVQDPGPFGLSTFLPGDEFGDFDSSSISTNQLNPRGGQNNEIEGVYIDDLIVGFAERGEVVINAPTSNLNFRHNPEYDEDPTRSEQPERPAETLTGDYRLEIRRSEEFGVPEDYDPIRLLLNETFGLGRSFDTNDRLTGAVTLVVPQYFGGADGDQFVISDGVDRLTFEYDSIFAPGVSPGTVAVTFDPRSQDPSDLAMAIRDAINSPQAQAVLDITATSGDSLDAGPTFSRHVELFGDTVLVNPSVGRNLRADLVAAETFNGRVTTKVFPQLVTPIGPVEDVYDYDTLARAHVTGYLDGSRDTLVATGKIGDHVAVGNSAELELDFPGNDVDIVKLHLYGGDTIDIDLDGANITRSSTPLTMGLLRVFDENGVPLANSFNSPREAPGEVSAASVAGVPVGNGYLRFTAPRDGYYFVSVASTFDPDTFTFSYGEYQLTIRPAGSAADYVDTEYHFGIGDTNRFRDQGQIIVQSNFVSDSAQYGIAAIPSSRDRSDLAPMAGTELPRPGSASLLRNQNTDRLTPGAVIANNVVVGGGTGGILFSGDAGGNGQFPAAVPFGRIVNNTVVGDGSGTGIAVGPNARPTILNNVISQFNTGINVTGGTAAGVVVGGNLFKDNNTPSNIPLGNSSVDLDATGGNVLFADAATRNFIPADQSPAIDSSFASLPDRQAFFNTVKQPAGISPSPILAPSSDAYGQVRVDDPAVETPGGVGANVFVDRGALDRADFDGPTAQILVPADFVAGSGQPVPGGDIDGSDTFVRLPQGNLSFFEIQLVEPLGTGPDPATIQADAVILTENGRRLVENVDYVFGYSVTSRTIRLTPLSGLWRPDSVYEITLNNSDRLVIEAPRGDQITDGDLLEITDAQNLTAYFEYDTGNVLAVPQSLLLTIPRGVGANGFNDGQTFQVLSGAQSATFELTTVVRDTSPNIAVPVSPNADAQAVRDAILAALLTEAGRLDIAPIAIGTSQIQLGSLAGDVVLPGTTVMTVSGIADGIADGDIFAYQRNGIRVQFEFSSDASTSPQSDVRIDFARTDTPQQLAVKMAQAISGSLLGLPEARAIEGGRVVIGGSPADVIEVNQTPLMIVGRAGVTGPIRLAVAANATALAMEGETIEITVGGVTRVFEYTTDSVISDPSFERIVLSTSASRAAIATATRDRIAAVFPNTLTPTATGTTVMLGEPVGSRVDASNSSLVVTGLPGGAIRVPVVPSSSFTADTTVTQLVAAIDASPLNLTRFAPGGGSLWFGNVQSIVGTPVTVVDGMRDRAGNLLAPNRANAETQFTILMPEVRLDYGDAPLSYENNANGGFAPAAHTVSDVGRPRLGVHVDTEAGNPYPQSDDDSPALSASSSAASFTVSTSTGEVSILVGPDDASFAPTAGQSVTLTIGGEMLIFELTTDGNLSVQDAVAVMFDPSDDAPAVAAALAAAIDRVTGSEIAISLGQPRQNEVIVAVLDDEDGVAIGSFQPANSPAPVDGLFLDANGGFLGFLNPVDSTGSVVSITVDGGGLLDAWVDFNGDGDWNDADEQVLSNFTVLPGENRVTIFTPPTATEGLTWSRFRLSSAGNQSPHGVAIGGEVEDYQVRIAAVGLPVAEDDAYTLQEDVPLVVAADAGVLANDQLFTLASPRAEVDTDVSNGQLTLNDDGSFTYVPNADFVGTDMFTYSIIGDQPIDPSDPNTPLLPVRSRDVATVTLTVTVVNDPPQFDVPGSTTDGAGNEQSLVEIRETDDATAVNLQWATGVLPGPSTATDERQSQSVTFTVTPASGNPSGLLQTAPTISPLGVLSFTPVPDAVGSAVFVVTAVDNGNSVPPQPGDDNTSDPVTLTIALRPVNDPPRPVNTNTGGSTSPDDAWSVDSQGAITYTLREDNSQPVPQPAAPYRIPMARLAGQSSTERIGLLEVFEVGPANERDATFGGSQTLQLTDFPQQTARGGSLVAERDGSGRITALLYTPPKDYNNTLGGPDSFTYTLADDGTTYDFSSSQLQADPLSVTNTVSLILNPVNDPPQFDLSQTTITALEDSPLLSFEDFVVNAFAGDPATAFDETDLASGQSVQFSVTAVGGSDPASLFASGPQISDDGTLSFRPRANAFGIAIFQVLATDNGPDNSTRGDRTSSQAKTLTITIQPQNDAPVPANNNPVQFSLQEDGSYFIPLRAGGSGPQGLLDKFVVGPVTGAGDESADILPRPGANQTLSLGQPIPASTTGGGTLTRVFDDATGQLTGLNYRPQSHFNGTDSFIYSVVDNGVSVDLNGNVLNDPKTAFATATLTVSRVNDPPQFSGAASVTAPEDAGEDTPGAFVGLTVVPDWATNIQAGPASATDENAPPTAQPPGQTVSFQIVNISGDAAGLFAEQPTASPDGTLRFRTNPDANGAAVFTVVAVDNGNSQPPLPDDRNTSDPKTFTITVTPVNDPPTFTPGSTVQVNEDSGPYVVATPWATAILPGPADEVAAGQTVRFEVEVDPQDAAKFSEAPVITDNGFLRFTPAADAHGTAIVSVTAIDSENGRSEAIPLTITIAPQNDTPVSADDSASGNEDAVLRILRGQLLSNDSDADLPGDALTITNLPATSLSGATLSLAANGDVLYDPRSAVSLQALAAGQSLSDTFTYRLTDSTGLTSNVATVTVQVSGINDAPTVRDDNVSLTGTSSAILRPLDNDFDVDNGDAINPASIAITLQPAFGSLTVQPDGTLVYSPFAGFRGTDLIRYTVADGSGAVSQPATITITSNDAPVAANDSFLTYRDESIDLDVLANDSDADGTVDSGSLTLQSQPTNGTAIVLANGRVRYVPNPGFSGTDTFSYRVRDDRGQISNTASVSVRVVASRLQNPNEAADVNADGDVSALDALLVINYLNRNLPPQVPSDAQGPPFYDVDGNRVVQPLDALRVINALNRRARDGRPPASGEGEALAPVIQPTADPSASQDRASQSEAESLQPLTNGSKPPAASVYDDDYLAPAPADDWVDAIARDQADTAADGDEPLDRVWNAFHRFE